MSLIDKLIRRSIRDLKPYSSARDEFQGEATTFLDANESPFNTGLNRYPDPLQKELKLLLSKEKSVSADQIMLGNGSDEVIDLLFRAFCEPGKDNVIVLPPTYGMYSVCAAVNDVEVREVVLIEGERVDLKGIEAAADGNSKLLFLCSPNNPTGSIIDINVIEDLLSAFSGLVVVDEAYIDFSSTPSCLMLLGKHPNLVILQTFSKAWGLAGVRLGVGYGSVELIDVLNKIKPPYNVNQLTQRVVMEALRNKEQVESWVTAILAQREVLELALSQSPVVKKVWGPEANFILFEVGDPDGLYEALVNNGVIVRNRSRLKGCEGCLRITVGTMEENLRFLEKLNEYAKEVVV